MRKEKKNTMEQKPLNSYLYLARAIKIQHWKDKLEQPIMESHWCDWMVNLDAMALGKRAYMFHKRLQDTQA